jgi:thiazole tautomerase (transcriptional regulator TenI)
VNDAAATPRATALPRLHVVTARDILERTDFVPAALGILELGEVALHLRAHGDSGRLLLDRACALRSAMPDAPLFVNDRVDVAWIARTGAHLPEAGLTVAQARLILDGGTFVGRSLHEGSALPSTAEEVPDYVFYGHVFATTSKPGLPPSGLQSLSEFVAAARSLGATTGETPPAASSSSPRGADLPVIAIGGISVERIAPVLACGAYGIAVISGVWGARVPSEAAARYLEAIS